MSPPHRMPQPGCQSARHTYHAPYPPGPDQPGAVGELVSKRKPWADDSLETTADWGGPTPPTWLAACQSDYHLN
jgi:hypothetical protein